MKKPGFASTVMVLSGSLVCATASLAQLPDLEGTFEARTAAPAEVVVWNRPVVVLRAAIGGVSPQERAEGVPRRIGDLQIQDAFNELGVQITPPHFENQPEQRVFVPRESWNPNPAKEPSGG
jgi:hypothetical protein